MARVYTARHVNDIDEEQQNAPHTVSDGSQPILNTTTIEMQNQLKLKRIFDMHKAFAEVLIDFQKDLNDQKAAAAFNDACADQTAPDDIDASVYSSAEIEASIPRQIAGSKAPLNEAGINQKEQQTLFGIFRNRFRKIVFNTIGVETKKDA